MKHNFNNSKQDIEILCEAESFDYYGGWALDSQFEDTMGSPYLLAHGLGKPVEDARTTITISYEGEYRVWVRAKDWVQLYHPGRFELHINNQRIGKDLGANDKDWNWQFAGIIYLEKGNAEITLHDLTGFEGRW